MKILYSPQRSDDVINYQFNGEIVTATYQGQSELFDFTEFPEGGQLESVETSLPINPIIHAQRVNGELMIELIYFHSDKATDTELYPEWVSV